MRAFAAIAAATVLLTTQVARAQDAEVEGIGYKVGEGIVFHPIAGLETGYISNVFYSDSNPIASPVLRALAEFAFATLPPQRLEEAAPGIDQAPPGEPPKLTFRTGLRLRYTEYLSTNHAVQQQRNLALGANAHLTAFPQGTFKFGADEGLTRDTRPVNFESTGNLNRWINHARARLVYQPGGRALKAGLRYENYLDYFESSRDRFANRLQHLIGLRTSWQFLPVTQFYFDGSFGFFGRLGNQTINGMVYKQSSNPLRLILGANTAITPTLTTRLFAGFGKGFYSQGADFTGPLGGAELGYRYAPRGRVVASYRYDFKDSINANFYTEHAIKARVDQQVSLVLLHASAGLRFRSYEGISPIVSMQAFRDDTIFDTVLRARYQFRDWLAALAEYNLTLDKTGYRYSADGQNLNPGYVRHEVTVSIRAAL